MLRAEVEHLRFAINKGEVGDAISLRRLQESMSELSSKLLVP